VDAVDILVRLLVAAGLTAVIGLDRELRGKPAGLRTNIVVGTATAAFAYIGAEVISGPGADPTRIASQVVSGIGFLGGGAIFAAGDRPSGLTTAAALWGSAAVGMAAGLGSYLVALLLVGVLVAVLWPLDLLAERRVQRYGRHDLHAQVVLSDLGVVDELRAALTDAPLRIVKLALVELGERPVADVQLAGRGPDLEAAIGAIEALPGAVAVVHPGIGEPQ
jgi:putative Mg2+ transporter-C (MgtC) family protein